MSVQEQYSEFYFGGKYLTDHFFIRKKNAITHTPVLIVSISRDRAVAVAVVD
jgi:hypothetical protein